MKGVEIISIWQSAVILSQDETAAVTSKELHAVVLVELLYLRKSLFRWVMKLTSVSEFSADVWIFSSPTFSCCDCLAHMCRRRKELKARTVWLGCPEKSEEKFPKNIIKNQKYNVFTFVPGVSRLSPEQQNLLLPSHLSNFTLEPLIFSQRRSRESVFPALLTFMTSTLAIHPSCGSPLLFFTD